MPSMKKCVVVTGFGPFKGHNINASWISVQELARLGLDADHVELVIYEIPVIYDEVKKIIPQLWEKHKPVLIVHVGVSGVANELTLEQQAHNDGYNRNDVQERVPHKSMCVDGSCHDIIVSGINMSLVCEEVNAANHKVSSVVSHDAGRYLCDFTYFTSLNMDKDRTAFIHVPPVDGPYTATEMAIGLRTAIHAMLKQLNV
ncbi:hypothetical protein BsWGS_05592 [Bradybaena similaris]